MSAPGNFVARFFENLAAHPERVFVTEVRGSTLVPTNGHELSRLVGLARKALRERGVEAKDRVVFIANNSARWVALDLAILAEGAIAVPLYTRQAPGELVGMIGDCTAKLVVCEDEALAAPLRALGLEPLLLEAMFVAEHPVFEPPRFRGNDDLVTIIYTSGTSGEPKGVTYSVANVDYMLPVIRDAIGALLGRALTQNPGSAPSDRVFHYLPFCFAGSRMVLWMTLFRASGIYLSTDLTKLVDEMKAAKPHYYLNVPFLLERVRLGVEKKVAEKPAPIRALWNRGKAAYLKSLNGELSLVDKAILSISKKLVFQKIRAQIGADLICLICGSAALPEDTQRWFEMLGIPVYQVYGLTETTAIVTMDKPDAPVTQRLARVGWPIPGVSLRLGEEDELQVLGPNIFPSYWGRPEASAETRTADGWFRTGDQAELGKDSQLKLIGRVKNVLVPLSGHNVAPEPIEEKLLRLPGVEQAVVFGHAKKHLVAVLTGDGLAVERLMPEVERLNQDLPFYKRVRKIHVTAERLTPENGCLTANQKLKRKAIEKHFAAALAPLWEAEA